MVDKIKNKKPSQKWKCYSVESGVLKRKACCPKCGPGIFLAIHKDRQSCGLCGYTIFGQKKQI